MMSREVTPSGESQAKKVIALNQKGPPDCEGKITDE
jgi:hypothetical protein